MKNSLGVEDNKTNGGTSKAEELSSKDTNNNYETKDTPQFGQLQIPPSPPRNLDISVQPRVSADELETYDDEQFEYEYDDLLVDDTLEPNPSTTPLPSLHKEDMSPILISEDPPFTKQDLEDFINNGPAEQEPHPITFEGSFHSMQNSMHSTSSFVVELGKLKMNHVETSTSNSSKRKEEDGVEDMASSSKMGKKRKNR